MATVTEIAPDIYRISSFVPDYGMQFNQFLVKDQEPLLYHTGLRSLFEATRDAVATVLPPSRIRWIGYSHFESDECGTLNEWLSLAPEATPVCGFVGAMVNLNDFAARAPRVLQDDEVLRIGDRRLRFLATPHVPHSWDAGLMFEESAGTLLCSDLFFHPGDPEPLTTGDVVGRARDTIRQGLDGPFANDMPYTPYTDRTLKRLADLAPRTLAIMHGSSYSGDGGAALRGLAEVVRELLGAPR